MLLEVHWRGYCSRIYSIRYAEPPNAFPILPYILGLLLTSHLAKDLQESPHPNPTENRYRQVIIPSKDINHLAGRCYESCA
jgi:hypothetical protein